MPPMDQEAFHKLYFSPSASCWAAAWEDTLWCRQSLSLHWSMVCFPHIPRQDVCTSTALKPSAGRAVNADAGDKFRLCLGTLCSIWHIWSCSSNWLPWAAGRFSSSALSWFDSLWEETRLVCFGELEFLGLTRGLLHFLIRLFPWRSEKSFRFRLSDLNFCISLSGSLGIMLS